MKKMFIPILAILMVLSLLSCSQEIRRMENGDVNQNIYPYLKFELSSDSTYYTAYVVEGAKLEHVSIPGFIQSEDGKKPVKVFTGFKNPMDAVNLEVVILDANILEVSEGAFDYAENIKRVAEPTIKGELAECTYEAAPGAYKVSVGIMKDGITFASGSVVATVYSNLTTTVSGNLVEMVTDASFDPSINPDIMNRVASIDSVDYSTIPESGSITLSESVEAGAKVEASVPKTAVAEAIKQVTGNESATNEQVSMSVSVNTTSATSQSIELEIIMSATVKYTDDSGKEVVKTEPVSEFGNNNIITVEVELQKNLQNVRVTHSGNSMSPIQSGSSEGYSYDAETGVLTIKTSSFSPFTVEYNEPIYVASVGGVSYTTLQDAVDAASSGATIVLTNDVVVNETVAINKAITIDLNGYSINGNKVRALHIKEKTTTITGSGTITSDVDNVGSSVIRVGDNNASNYASLYIKEGVTVTTDTAYGITVFGSKNEYLYIYGSVISNTPENSSYDGCAIATLGTDTTKSFIYIKDGATVSALNTNAIYMPSGNLTVDESESTTISGRTGIYVKSGSATIKGGVITGNGPDVEYNYYGNGGISTGDAFVVDSCGYPNGKPSVSITGGTFMSSNANSVASYHTEGNTTVTEFITGGTFSSDPSDDYIPLIYDAVEDGTNWVVSLKNSTAEKPIRITSEQEWLSFAKYANIDTTTGNFYVVEKDLDFSGTTQKAGLRYFAGNIDFQNHTITGLNGSNTYTVRYPSLFKIVNAGATIKNLNYELPNLRTDYTVKPIGSIEGTGIVTLENITISGNLNMTDNNTGLLVDFIGGNSKFDGTVKLIDCKNHCNMVNTGYSSAFIGGIYRYDNNENDGNNITLEATGCINYGTITSTESSASMLIANGTRHEGDNLVLNISNCKNEGIILAAPGMSSFLAMPEGFYKAEQLSGFENSEAICNANGGVKASLTRGELSTTNEGKFDLVSAVSEAPDAVRFELVFGFQGTGGLGAGGVTQYTFTFDSNNNVENVYAYRWVNMKDATGNVAAHVKYGTTYYTDEAGHYVYNQPGYTMSKQPTVNFVAYGANGNVLLVDYYSYSN